jgi:hypothetical protein
MSFFTNLLEGLKGTALIRTNSAPRTSGNVISNQINDEDWEIVNPHEVGVFYHDRVTLLLSPRRETRHQILLTDMPKSSGLLNHLRILHPSHRTIHLFFPDLPMVKSYLDLQSVSADALAIETPWLDIIELAATADIFQDTYIEDKALAALKQKALIALTPGNAASLFEDVDFSFAYVYHTRTGDGGKLSKTLHGIRQMDMYKSELPVVKLPKAEDMESKSEGLMRKTRGSKYDNSMLKGRGLVVAKKEEDDKVHPVRQPTVPPNLEALKCGDVSNFIYPGKKSTRM